MNVSFISQLALSLLSLSALIFVCSDCGSPPQYSKSANEETIAPKSSQQSTKISIRSVNLANFAYPNFRLPDGTKTTLRSGEAFPAHVNYGDVTGDGLEESMAVLPMETRGTAILHHVYIFSMRNGSLRLLWDFETCDRADGGLRKVFAQSGVLVIELYGRAKVLGTNLCSDDGTRKEQPYPYAITRSRFEWTKEQFRQAGEVEIFSDPEGYGSPIMPLYQHPKN